MNLKQTINEIFLENTNYLTAQQALNQARSLKSLSNDLYTDPLRFVYELVQNCDDACQTKSILRIAIVDHRYLIIGHNGKPFSKEDVRSLCDVGCSTKGQDNQKTGYKGLGFKAVFGKSDNVLVLSNGEYFRFDVKANAFKWNSKWGLNQQAWETANRRIFEYPWQICPIWTEKKEVPESIQKWFLGQVDAVATIIQLKNIAETTAAIEQLKDQPHVFMFLRNIRTVRFSINLAQETSLNINVLRDKSMQIIYDWKPMSRWLLYSCNIDVPEHARNDPRLPDKLQDAKTTELMLAARIDKNDNIESVQGRHNALFAYLPTKITTYNLPVLVNGNFLTNASREHIHTDSVWNQFLFARIPHEMVKWIGILGQQEKWMERALDLSPKPIPINDDLARNYNTNCSQAAEENRFLLNSDKKLLKISEAVIDVTGFSRPNCIGHELIRAFILRTYSPKPSIAMNPFIPNNNRVRQFKILIFDWDTCFAMLMSNEFLLNFTPEQDIQFITYLFNENLKQPQIQSRLRQLPFLMDHMRILRVTSHIYIPSKFNGTDWLATNDTDFYVHDEIMKWLDDNPSILNWLKSLGVTEKTDEIFVRRRIIPNVRNYTTLNNTLPTIKKLFAGFEHGNIRGDLLQQLYKLKLLSVDGTLVPADELYFSDSYLPRLPLNNFHLDPANFLSPIYLNEIQGAANNKKKFFLLLGVQEDIRLIRFNENHHNEMIAAYRYRQTENLFPYNSIQFQRCLTLPFLEMTAKNYEFALHFWQHVILSINVHELNQPEILVCDQQPFNVENLPYWFVRARPCIPTTTRQSLISTNVFSSDLRSIAGDFLPVFACNTRIPFPPEWQRFFQFKTQLSIEDHLQLLNLIYDRSKNAPLDDEIETSIQRIYTSLINCLSINRDQFRPPAPFYLLSSINNEFLPSTDLVISLSKDFTLPNQIPQLKISTGNLRHSSLLQFLNFFNIRQISINDLTLPANINAQPSLSLRAKIRDMQAYLFELTHSRGIRNHRIDNDLEIFEVDRLELCHDGTIPVLQRDIHDVNNRIYVTRPWTSHTVISKLPQILCKQFRLPTTMESDIRDFLLDDITSPTMTSLPTNLSVDLLGMEGTRAKFAMVIDRDNNQLFNHLGIDAGTTPADLLLQGLDAQNSPFSGYVYHHTHLENAVSILRDRAIKCRNNLPVNGFKDSAARQIIQATTHEAKNYARFYFRPLTPTQRCNENLGLPNLVNRYGNQPMCPIPVVFCIDLKAILSLSNIQWKVSLGNMANPQTEFDNTIHVLRRFDFQHVYADARTERGKYSSQQEFLINSQLNLNDLNDEHIQIIFQDENALYSLEQMIEHDYSTRIDLSFYFSSNPRIIIESPDENEIMAYIKDFPSSENSGELILQLSGQDTNRTIEGNLSKSFQRGHISTVYSDQQLSFIADLNTIEYVIYYKYENQMWLIHTNSSQPHFIPPTS